MDSTRPCRDRTGGPVVTMKLTRVQTGVLGFLRARPRSTVSDIIAATTPDDEAIREALNALYVNDLVVTVGYDATASYQPIWEVTDLGLARVGAQPSITSGVPSCPACVQIGCVCSISIVCIARDLGRHSTGCHGTHD